MGRLIGGDTSRYEVNKFVERKERQEEAGKRGDGVEKEDLGGNENGAKKEVVEGEVEKNNVDGLKVEVVVWKGKASLRAYVAKNDRLHYLRLIGGDTSRYEVNKFVE